MEAIRYRLKHMLPESELSAPAGAKTDHTSGSPSPATHTHTHTQTHGVNSRTQDDQSHASFI